MKACKKCGSLKDESEYYAKQAKCKECTKARVKANREANLDYYREFDRDRSNLPKRVAARKTYAQSSQGKAALARGSASWQGRNADKRKAHVITSNAIRDGKLIKQPCEVCGTTKNIQAHHDDYSKPLDVRWLCVTHHAEHHNNERERQRATA